MTARGQAVLNPAGEIQWVDGLMLDISERMRAETALVESKEALDIREKEARRLSELMAALTRVSMALSLAHAPDDLFRGAVEAGTHQLGFDRMGIWLLDENEPEMSFGTFGVDEQGNIRGVPGYDTDDPRLDGSSSTRSPRPPTRRGSAQRRQLYESLCAGHRPAQRHAPDDAHPRLHRRPLP